MRQKLINNINNEENNQIKYFLLNLYLDKYTIIKENDNERCEIYYYYKINNDILCVQESYITSLCDFDDLINTSSLLDIHNPFWTNGFEILNKKSVKIQKFIKLIKDYESERTFTSN